MLAKFYVYLKALIKTCQLSILNIKKTVITLHFYTLAFPLHLTWAKGIRTRHRLSIVQTQLLLQYRHMAYVLYFNIFGSFYNDWIRGMGNKDQIVCKLADGQAER